jgi:hypothetical protein
LLRLLKTGLQLLLRERGELLPPQERGELLLLLKLELREESPVPNAGMITARRQGDVTI